MAACEVKARLIHRDGRTDEFRADAGRSLASVLDGIRRISADASRVLTALVLQEKGSGVDAHEVDGSDEEEEDDDDEAEVKAGPPTKRMKTLRS